ncbi:hypothetical protein H5410_056805 [Solanum commersonii]|uniref:Uncharacterized protein n=1 Tax=Solanum commersonii TaxID=4109 RepID=A0A9J5WNA7_SOLCO|nr:hypothetical protein H5410_056805 [Solanum commersonii]
MDLARYGQQYIDGVESFLDFGYSYEDTQGDIIQNVVYDHLICYGLLKVILDESITGNGISKMLHKLKELMMVQMKMPKNSIT